MSEDKNREKSKIEPNSKIEWYLRGQMWTYEHILESEYWQNLPDKIDKGTLEKALRDAWDVEKAYAKNNGAWFARFYDVQDPPPKDVWCDRATEAET